MGFRLLTRESCQQSVKCGSKVDRLLCRQIDPTHDTIYVSILVETPSPALSQFACHVRLLLPSVTWLIISESCHLMNTLEKFNYLFAEQITRIPWNNVTFRHWSAYLAPGYQFFKDGRWESFLNPLIF